MSVFIYALCDPNNGATRYVGKSQNPSGRLRDHLRDISDRRLPRWLRSLNGIRPALVVLEEVLDSADWQAAERRWIARFHEDGASLCNHTDGGDGILNATSDTRAKISKSRRADWQNPERRPFLLSVLRSPARRAAISAALRGRRKSPEWVAKLPQNKRGRVLTAAQRAKISAGLIGNSNALGNILSVEARRRISLAMLRRTPRTGWVMSESERQKRSVSQLGRTKSEEWRAKISVGQKRSWARRRERV